MIWLLVGMGLLCCARNDETCSVYVRYIEHTKQIPYKRWSGCGKMIFFEYTDCGRGALLNRL